MNVCEMPHNGSKQFCIISPVNPHLCPRGGDVGALIGKVDII